MMAQTQTNAMVQCLVTFPVPIHLKAEALGSKTSVQFNGLTCELILPRLRKVAGPEIYSDALQAPYRIDLGTIAKRGSGIEWGYVWTRPDGLSYVHTALLRSTTAVSLSRDQARDYALKIAKGFDAWYGLARDWLEILSGQDLNDKEPPPSSYVHGSQLDGWTYRSGQNSWNTCYPNPEITAIIDSKETAASKSTWQRALRSASRGVTLPDEYIFIRDAKAAVRRDQGRRAVLDAGTATELAVTAALQAKYSSAKQANLMQLLLDSYRMLGRRVDLSKQLGIALPNTIVRDLIEPRNRAAHQGATIPHDEAARAVKVANEVVRKYIRLPK
jgi:hypothetical protein